MGRIQAGWNERNHTIGGNDQRVANRREEVRMNERMQYEGKWPYVSNRPEVADSLRHRSQGVLAVSKAGRSV